jgi:hypothetical protein
MASRQRPESRDSSADPWIEVYRYLVDYAKNARVEKNSIDIRLAVEHGQRALTKTTRARRPWSAGLLPVGSSQVTKALVDGLVSEPSEFDPTPMGGFAPPPE